MSLSDRWTLAALRTAARIELLDTSTRWWTDIELNEYLGAWQERLQDEFEFIWGTTTLSTATATLDLSSVAPDMLRLDAVYWNGRSIPLRTKQELDVMDREWRGASGLAPNACYQDDDQHLSFWHPPTSTGSVRLEYPILTTFAADTSTMDLPAWTKYSAINYVAFRAYLRAGPNQSIERAYSRKARFLKQLARYKVMAAGFLPERPGVLAPASEWEVGLVEPDRTGGQSVPIADTTQLHQDEVPSGTVNGTNTTFTLTSTPNPTGSLKVFVDGIKMTVTTHYTLSGTTITFVTAFVPITGQKIFATYRYTA